MVKESSDHVVLEMTELAPKESEEDSQENPTRSPRPTLPQDESWKSWVQFQSGEQKDKEFDREMLHRAIADTGRWAYGTVSQRE